MPAVSKKPKSTKPKSTKPKSTKPKSTKPKSTKPKSMKPKSMKSMKPKSMKPKSMKATKPKSKKATKPKSKKATKPKSKKRKLTGAALVYHQVAVEMGHFMPSKVKHPAEYKQVRAVYDELKAKKSTASIKPLALWKKAALKAGYGTVKKDTKAGQAIQREFSCRMATKCGSKRTKQCTAFRAGCKKAPGSKKAK